MKCTNPSNPTLLVVPLFPRRGRKDPETWRMNLVTLPVPLLGLENKLDPSCIMFSLVFLWLFYFYLSSFIYNSHLTIIYYQSHQYNISWHWNFSLYLCCILFEIWFSLCNVSWYFPFLLLSTDGNSWKSRVISSDICFILYNINWS